MALFQRSRVVAAQGGADPYQALREDGGIQWIISTASAYSNNVIYAGIVNKDGIAIAHSFEQRMGTALPQK